MAMFIQISDHTYPHDEWSIRLANPRVSYPSPMPDVVPDYVRVADSAPVYNAATQAAVEIAPVQIAGVWTQQWSVVALDAPTIAAKAAQAAQDAQDAAMLAAAKADTTIAYLLTHTPAEVQAIITSTVTDLPTARTMLTRFALAIAFIARGILR
jgi:hypothetical protein